MRHFFSITDEGTHFNKVTFFSLASFLDLALLYLLSLREPKHSHDKLSRCKSLP